MLEKRNPMFYSQVTKFNPFMDKFEQATVWDRYEIVRLCGYQALC